jgi:Protein of unknown function (DUF2865)
VRITRVVAAAAVLAAAAAAVAPVHAQSILQRLFGSGVSREPDFDRERMGTGGYIGRYGGINPYGRSGSDRYNDHSEWPQDYSAYNTMCVRLCDGFYFPISYGVRRERLYKDNRTCMRRCDGEARLFHFPTNGGSVETMVDMAGRAYTALPNAFRYRKSLVSGCMCQRAPWSDETASRHQSHGRGDGAYARGEAGQLDDGDAGQADGYRAPPSYAGNYDAEPERAPEPDYPAYDDGGGVYAAPPNYYEPAPRRRMPRTPWARGWLDE